MTYYRTDSLMWDDEDFVNADDLERTVWQLLLTGPQRNALPGLQRVGMATLAETLRRPIEAVEEAFAYWVARGKASFDPRLRVIWVPNAPKYNEAESPNQLRAWWNRWREIPDCDAKYKHIANLKERAGLHKETHVAAWNDTFGTVSAPSPKGSPTPPSNPSQGSAELSANPSAGLSQPFVNPSAGFDQPSTNPPEGLSDSFLARAPTIRHIDRDSDRPRASDRAMAGEAGSTREEFPYDIAKRVWLELWQAKYKLKFQFDGNMGEHGDDKALQRIGHKASELGDCETVLRHKIATYLKEPGARNWLIEHKHPLKSIERDWVALGEPRTKPPPSSVTRIRPVDASPPLSTAAIAAQVGGVLASLSASADHAAPAEKSHGET